MTAGQRLHDYAAAELARAIACLGWRGPRIHAGVHQARKSLRRTRATLALGAAVLGPGAVLIDRELQRMNWRLSELRDAQALVGTLDLLGRKADERTLALLRRARRVAAHARAERARSTLAEDPQLHDKRALLSVLLAALAALPWSDVDEAHVREALHMGATMIEEAGKRAQASGHDPDWHRWRRRARRLSQQLRAIDGAIAPPQGIEERSKKLAVLLGEAQDYALLREHCGKRSVFTRADRQVLKRLSDDGTAHLRSRIALALPAQEARSAGEPC